jgi:hypothetical protein
LNSRQCSDLPAPAQTDLSSQENDLLFQAGFVVAELALTSHGARRLTV